MKVHPFAITLGALGVGVAYQLDQAARVILVELGGPSKATDEEAAGVARVLYNRASKWGMLPSAVIRLRRGNKQGRPVWTLRNTEYEARMKANGPGSPGYSWAFKRALYALLGIEGATIGNRRNFIHLGNPYFNDNPVPSWVHLNPLLVGKTTFSGPA